MTAPRLAVVGASWGGMHALGRLLSGLDAANRLTIVVAQHRSADADGVLARYLAGRCPLPLAEAEDKDELLPGQVFLAPPDYHLLVDEGNLALSIEGAVRFSRPSIDLLFESAADSYAEAVVAVVLTGANDDGCRGVLAVKDAGGTVLAQDPATAERPEMPQAAVASGAVDAVLPIEALADRLNRLGAPAGSNR